MKRLLLVLALAAPLFAAQKSVLGTLAEFRGSSVEFGLQPDSGAMLYFKVSPETQVLRVPPGQHDLAKATRAAVTDLGIGDRLLVTFVEGMPEARRIVQITSTDIERRNQAERLDWQRRGIAGIVTAVAGDEVTVQVPGMQAKQTLRIDAGPRTSIRRYAPDSVRFSDALPSTVAEISVGDQLRARGDKNEDGSRMAAQDIVFGTFLTVIGPITAVNRETGEVQIRDPKTKAPLAIRVTADSRLKKMPDMQEMFAQMMKAPAADRGGQPKGPADMAQMLQSMPDCAIGDLQVGKTLVAVATRGLREGAITAILVVANIDGILQMAQSQPGAEGLSPMEAMSRMHHGAMDGPGGFNLPALIP